ncbi:MAG: DNA repair protein RecN [Treponema sp.]|jgi:DNA repair protein RecN (Recombination protein N)|nr:DNA repair protein RecN [Treponema sp.]
MLEELNIRNYALIENISLLFGGGFNVLTGETGAGKSIIVGSLSFLLGAKADADVIRTGAEEANVSAVISLQDDSSGALVWLSEREIGPEDGTIVIRRSLKSSGRGSIYIQNVPVTRGDLEEFMGLLFDIHGQHNHESLLRKESHRRYLDRFADLEDETAGFNRVFLELADKKKALELSLSSERDRENRLELLSYAVREIDAAAPRAGESRELEAESRRLADFEKLVSQARHAADALFDGELSVLSLARRAKTGLDAAAAIDGGLAALQKRLEDLYYEAEDVSAELRSYRDGLAFDPGRLEEVEERLALLFRLKKKYAEGTAAGEGGSAEEAILARRVQAQAEIEALSGAGENRDRLRAEIGALEKDLVRRASALSAKRRAASGNLGKRITEILVRLGMPHARFEAAVIPRTRDSGKTADGGGAAPPEKQGGLVCGPWGAEDIEFLISANTGEPLRDLSRIASGGELSRVMLAIKTVFSESGSAPAAGAVQAGGGAAETLVFDEIDAGIGGEVALEVGEYLARIGARKQIFCVTHLASIAVRADNHIKVEKKTVGGRTSTVVSVLDAGERRREIARMLAGDSGKAALAHADDLILRYGKAPRANG